MPKVRHEARTEKESCTAAAGKAVTSRQVTFLAALASSGCVTVSKERGHDQVASLVEQRSGRKTQWEHGPPDDARVADWVRKIVSSGLTRERAIAIALVNNPDLQATYEELGVSQAEMVQAGLLRNPTFSADLGFSISPGSVAEVRFSLVQDFLDLFVLPLRKEIAREQFEADTVRVAHRALDLSAEVEKAVATMQASVELVAFRRTVVEGAHGASELSDRQFEAGNISALEHGTERASYEQAKLDLAREEIELLESREKINRLLGLWGETTSWEMKETLRTLPTDEPKVDHLESLAIRQRLDVDAVRRQTVLLAKAVDLARTTRLVGRLEVGVDAHRDPDGPRVIGPNLVIDLPLFDRRQAYIARLEAQRREQERRLSAVAINTRSEVRLAQARLVAVRQTALHYGNTVLPLRRQLVEQAQLHYNGMFVSLFQLIAAKQAEVDAQRGYLEALRDYWMARAELTRAVGGRLPEVRTSPAPKSSPIEGEHHHGP